MRVLVACEYSGTVRDAFIDAGHEAVSADLLPSETPGPHHQGDVRDIIDDGWDLMIAHPPCTHLAVSGARWFKDKQAEQAEALAFVRELLDAPIDRIALENPVSIISSRVRKPDQIIQPWQFGHGETKATCLWLKNLPKLVPSDIVDGRENRVHRMPPGPDRWKERSRTFAGIAAAMADQWGGLPMNTENPAVERDSLRGTPHAGHTIRQLCDNMALALSSNHEAGGPELFRLDLLTSIIEAAEAGRAREVEKARSAGASWRRIGQQIGATKQAAQQRYGRKPSTRIDPDQLTID